MVKYKAMLVYLALIVLTALFGAAIAHVRADLGVFDPKLAFGLAAYTMVNIMSTMGTIVGGNVIVAYLLGRLVFILAWIPVGTIIAMVAHQMFRGYFGLMPLEQMGLLDAFLMYLPSVSLWSLVGGLIASFLRR